ncbi:uncharacterized protein LOC131935376 [Physella acuta]|uniref:uncharacterized protein LOC131935376 n=1 Tax=Physella acuta TaxID=109671 RepID=UPI0027DD191A|nr:uncharacterized protein LOC131935376 [Physella acuta]
MESEFRRAFKNSKTEEEIREVNLTWEDTLAQCKKQNDHEKYDYFTNFSKEKLVQHIKGDLKDDDNMVDNLYNLIIRMANLTTYIEHQFVDENEKDEQEKHKRVCGTGFIQRIRHKKGEICQCKSCENPENEKAKKWAIFTVTSVHHVVQRLQNNMGSSEVRLFYDTTDSLTWKTLDILKVQDTDKDGEYDWCAIQCVTHDKQIIKELQKNLSEYETLQKEIYKEVKETTREDLQLVVITGHPHGMPKQVSIGEKKGKEVLKDVRERQEWCRYGYDTATCPGNSGSPVYIVGQPLCGFGYWFGHTHNHSTGYDAEKNEKFNFSSIGTIQLP